MKRKIEKTYGSAIRGLFYAVNPLKKKFLKTYCTVHKFIMIQSIEIMKNEKYDEQYEFFRKRIKEINKGVTWADQDFKSSNHFYHFSEGKGLFGFSNALNECKKYYNKSVAYLDAGDISKAMFYFGAACHLIQDATVPQHVNNKLLKSHRNFELWIIKNLMSDYSFVAYRGIIKYNSLDEYIKQNAILANKTYINNINIKNKENRYEKIAETILKQAQKSTAGFMLDYYELIKSKI